jgi:hypothetical protein
MAAGKIQKQMVEIPHRAKIRIEGIWEHRTSNVEPSQVPERGSVF